MSEQWKEIVAEWQSDQGENTFMGRNPAGGTVQMGSMEGEPGAGPMELVLMALAGCTGIDIVSILHKKRQPLKDLKIEVRGKRAETYPMVYTEIEVNYLLWGDGLDTGAVEQAIHLSEDKYCSVGLMLRASVPIKTSYQIIQSEKDTIGG